MIGLDPNELAQEIQLCLNRTRLPATHIATRTEIVEKDGVYAVATIISPIDIESDNRYFTIVESLTNNCTVMGVARALADKFHDAINGDDYERASADSKSLGLH